MHPRNKLLSLLLVTGAVAVATATYAYAQLGGSDSVQVVELSRLGVPVGVEDISAGEKTMLVASRVNIEGIRAIASRGGTDFYIGVGANGQSCFMAGLDRGVSPHFGIIHCPTTTVDGPTFPSATVPLLDFSAYQSGLDGKKSAVSRLLGFAADSVGEVAIIDAAGATHRVAVEDNVYALASSAIIAPREIVAFDRNNEVIYRHRL